MNPADLCTKIGTTIPSIIGLLSNNNPGVREASVNVLSKFAEHGKSGPSYYAIC